MKNELYYNAVDTLKGMIARPSFSRREAEVADYLQELWTSDGHAVRRKGNNLWILPQDCTSGKPTLLLNSHIDTVMPSNDWTLPPFQAEDDGDRLYGLGSNDAGASLVSLYSAFRYLTSMEQPYNLVFLASAEEEISGEGGLSSVMTELPPIDFAIVGEPTGMNPAIAEKGLMVLDCEARGKAGHAARNEGVNAIAIATEDIQRLHAFRFPKESPLLGAVKMSVTVIEAGRQHNVIPDRCAFTVDVRTNECYTNEQIYNEVKGIIRSSVKARSFRLNSSCVPIEHPFVQRVILLGKSPFGSPTLSDQALMSCPSVKIGPGDSARSHASNEYIRLDEIREAIEIYTHILNKLDL